MKGLKSLGGFAAALVCSLASVTLYASDSTSYVQDGLVLQFDAIENAGRNQHDSTATVWKDLVGSRDGTISGKTQWGEKFISITGTPWSEKGKVAFDGTLTAAHTIEVCCKLTGGQNCGYILGEGNGTGAADFPKLAISSYYSSYNTMEKCGIHLTGYGVNADVKAIYSFFNLTAGETISYSQSGDAADGTDYYYNGRFYWNQTGLTTACENTGVTVYVGNNSSANQGVAGEFYSVRIYNRVLTAAERAQNARVDQERYLSGPVEVAGTVYVDPENGDDANDGREYRNEATGEAYTNCLKTISAYYSSATGCKTRDRDFAFVPGVHEIEDQTTGSNYQPNIVVRGATGDPKDVVLVAKGDPHRFFYGASNTSTNYLFHSLTFRGFSAPSGSGGAIYNAPGASVCDGMVISNCVFESCSAAVSGGGFYYYGRGLRIFDCTFDKCSCGGGSGGGGGGFYVDPMPKTADPLFVKGCTFTDNFTTNVGVVSGGGHGGGAYVFCNTERVCDIVFEDCTFLRNHTLSGILNDQNASNNITSAGGGLCATLTRMSRCRFEGNWTDSTDAGSKTNAPGGGWCANYYGFSGRHTVVENCQFITNFAHGISGAFHLVPYKINDYGVNFSNCVFTGNSSTGNGAVSFMQWTGGGIRYVNFYDCLFNKNRAPAIGNANGAGYGTSGQLKSSDVLNLISCSSEYLRCRFEDNVGYGRSGALVIFDTDNNKGYHTATGFRVEDCVFARNVIAVPPVARQAASGGAIWVYGANPSTNVVVRNCLFENNVNSNDVGGAILFSANKPFEQCAVESCTFVGNEAYFDPDKTMSNTAGPFGSVVFASTPVQSYIRNCLFADNHRVGDPAMVREVGYYTKSSFTNCLFKTASDPAGHYTIKLADGELGCKVGYDPKFYDAANGDYRIVKRSPARDTGVNQPWMFAEGAHDLSITNGHGRLVPRVTGDTVDIGCYEWMPGNPPEPGMLLFVR